MKLTLNLKSNPLLTRLPSFSNTPPSKGSRFKIVCMYGTGVPTERKFFYKDFVHTGKNGSNRFLFDAEVNAKDVGISQGALLADG